MKPCRALRPHASAPARAIVLPDITWHVTSGTETTPMRGAVSKADDLRRHSANALVQDQRACECRPESLHGFFHRP